MMRLLLTALAPCLLLALASCSPDPGRPEPRIPGADWRETPPDGTVLVQVLSQRGKPLADVHLVSSRENAIIDRTMTDAGGWGALDVMSGGDVTAHAPGNSLASGTVQGVQAGDEFRLLLFNYQEPVRPLTVQVTGTTEQVHAWAGPCVQGSIFTGSGSVGTSHDVVFQTVPLHCSRGGTLTIYAEGGGLSGTTTDVPADATFATVQLQGPPSPGTVAVSVLKSPPHAFSNEGWGGRGFFVRNGQLLGQNSWLTCQDAGASFDCTATPRATVGATGAWTLVEKFDGINEARYQIRAARTDGEPIVIDTADLALPPTQPLLRDLDTPRPAIVWTQHDPLPAGLVVAHVRFHVDGYPSHEWYVAAEGAADPGDHAIRFPPVPADLAQYAFAPDAYVFEPVVEFHDSPAWIADFRDLPDLYLGRFPDDFQMRSIVMGGLPLSP